jgi:hypothetical protein
MPDKLSLLVKILQYGAMGGAISSLALPGAAQPIVAMATSIMDKLADDLGEVDAARQGSLEAQRQEIIADGHRVAQRLQALKDEILKDEN